MDNKPGAVTPGNAAALLAGERAAQVARRDAGLVRAVGPLALTASFIGILVGSAIFTVPAVMASAVGSYAPLAYIACALSVGATLLCFAEGCSRVPTCGGVPGYVGAAFGPYLAFLSGALLYVSSLLATSGIAAAAIDILGTAAPPLAADPQRGLLLVGWFFALAAVNIAGVGIAARFGAIATAIKLVPLLLLVALGIPHIDISNLQVPMPEAGWDIGRAAILGIFLFLGIEMSLAVAGEVREPARTIPRAIIGSILAYTALCIAVQLIAQGLLGAELGRSIAPLADAGQRVAPLLGLLLGAGAVISMLGWTAIDALSSPRMLFALSRDGCLPALIGRTHARTHAPWIASLLHATLASGLAVVGNFTALAILSTLTCILVYLFGIAAALRLRASDVALAGPPVRVPALPWVAAFGAGTLVWVAMQSTRDEAIGILVFIALASLLYRFRRRVG